MPDKSRHATQGSDGAPVAQEDPELLLSRCSVATHHRACVSWSEMAAAAPAIKSEFRQQEREEDGRSTFSSFKVKKTLIWHQIHSRPGSHKAVQRTSGKV